jgi:hypothetical protein
MTSGYMFTRIRGAPYSGPNGAWIAQGYQNQYGQEVQVIAMVCTSSHTFLNGLLLIIHRWNLGWIFLDVDCRHTAPIVAHPSENPGIPLDRSKLPRFQHFSIAVPRQKPRLVGPRQASTHSADISVRLSIQAPSIESCSSFLQCQPHMHLNYKKQIKCTCMSRNEVANDDR